MLTHADILRWLQETDADRLADLWRRADRTRRKHVGDAVHLRGLVEVSSYCVRSCHYCGLRAANAELSRYRMTDQEVLDCAHRAVDLGYGTVVLQAGEDPALTKDRVVQWIRRIKRETRLAVTLSLGERTDEELAAWREAGADRYLLRFETSNVNLFRRLHPPPAGGQNNSRELTTPGPATDSRRLLADTGKMPVAHEMSLAYDEHPRIAILHSLRELGYEVGSGVMIGIPGQTWDDLARDMELFAELQLDMIGCGPYIAHPHTPLHQLLPLPSGSEIGVEGEARHDAGGSQFARAAEVPVEPRAAETSVALDDENTPADELTTYKVIALARLVCPRTNIPATTALATLNTESGRELGLSRGANVVMPNLTPTKYREMYEIYPGKACVSETAQACSRCLRGRIASIGRSVGTGRGDSPSYAARQTQPDTI